MKTNLKDNIWIEGFYYQLEFIGSESFFRDNDALFEVIYSDKTSEIPEEIAKECVELGGGMFVNYYKSYNGQTICSPKQSIQSACDEPYCIIYKTE